MKEVVRIMKLRRALVVTLVLAGAVALWIVVPSVLFATPAPRGAPYAHATSPDGGWQVRLYDLRRGWDSDTLAQVRRTGSGNGDWHIVYYGSPAVACWQAPHTLVLEEVESGTRHDLEPDSDRYDVRIDMRVNLVWGVLLNALSGLAVLIGGVLLSRLLYRRRVAQVLHR
jgi:hypothetical protein